MALMKAYMVGVARHSFAIGIDKWECVYMDNLQVKYKVLTKAYLVGVASHFLAIVVNKWECVLCTNYKGKYTVLRKAYTVGVASHFLAVLTNGQLLQLQEAFCGRLSALSHESATEREFWLLQTYGKFVAQV